MVNKFNPIQYVEDDGLPFMEVGSWAEVKYKLMGKYCDIFTSGMKNKWNLVYLDLFSGPGYAKKRKSPMLMKSSALIALSLPNKFDYYAFNDMKSEYSESLRMRIERDYKELDARVYNDDANNIAKEMVESIPNFNNRKGTLIFCFLDPFSLNLNFKTVEYLGKQQADFLILHALQMAARRNHHNYKRKQNKTVSLFTGNPNWREEYKKYHDTPTEFMKMVTNEFDKSIKNIGYKSASVKERIKNDSGSGIYYLCFYSKHDKGIEFFEKIQKTGGNDQYGLF